MKGNKWPSPLLAHSYFYFGGLFFTLFGFHGAGQSKMSLNMSTFVVSQAERQTLSRELKEPNAICCVWGLHRVSGSSHLRLNQQIIGLVYTFLALIKKVGHQVLSR